MNDNKITVKCGVDNCYYNDKHICQADMLEVNTMGDGKADTADGTRCNTFENKSNMS